MTPEERAERVRHNHPAFRVNEVIWDKIEAEIAAAIREAEAEAVRAERFRLVLAIRGPSGGELCACIGCPHPANCRCGCPECAAIAAVLAERERCVGVLDAIVAREEALLAEFGGSPVARDLAIAWAARIREGV